MWCVRGVCAVWVVRADVALFVYVKAEWGLSVGDPTASYPYTVMCAPLLPINHDTTVVHRVSDVSTDLRWR